VRDQAGDSIVRNDGVCINADVDVIVKVIERVVERLCLAGVGLGEDEQAAAGNIFRVGSARGLSGGREDSCRWTS
jgi:microsomal dipeptidase-like Zn-dependent dipeptidase